MDLKDMTKGICTLQLNSISKVEDDPLLIKATYSILDFFQSGNKQIVPKDLAIEASPTLKGKPLLCVYTPNTSTDANMMNDHFGSHGEMLKTDRYGKEYIGTNAIAIGTALEGGYIGKIKDKDGNEIEALLCDFYLWADRNIEILQLINEMHENGMPLYSSCEYYYSNYEVKDGVQTIKSPLIFSGHCVLGSGENNCEVIAPAYDSSMMLSFNEKLNKAINQELEKQHNNKSDNNSDLIINKNNDKEGDKNMENIFIKSLNAISLGDVRDKIFGALQKVMSYEAYEMMWISSYNIYPEEKYFVYETYEDNAWVNYKVPYSVDGDTLTVDYEARTKAEFKGDWVAMTQMQVSQNSLNEKQTELEQANLKIEELTASLNSKETEVSEKEELIKSLNTKVESTETEKVVTIEKFNELTETLTSLNAKVKELQPLADAYNQEQYEKALNEATNYYKDKFESVEALDELEKDEVKELIKKSINSDENVSKQAKFSLNNIIVEKLQNKKTPEGTDEKISLNSINETCTETKDLRNDIDEFEQFYGFKR